jgi:hypothetical protein
MPPAHLPALLDNIGDITKKVDANFGRRLQRCLEEVVLFRLVVVEEEVMIFCEFFVMMMPAFDGFDLRGYLLDAPPLFAPLEDDIERYHANFHGRIQSSANFLRHGL